MLRTWLSPARPAPATTPGRHARREPRDRSRAARAGRPRPRTPRRPPGRTSRRSGRQLIATVASTTRRPTSQPRRATPSTSRSRPTPARCRATGEPYVTHPIASAQILAELGIDPVAVQAALLHDVPEDTEYSLADVEERFGAEVAHLVDGVTKLSKFSTHSHEQQQAENIRKMFLAMAEDIRVVLIKLADRLHNMRTLDAPAVREAAAHRPPDDGDLRPARRAARDLADQVGARGPRVQGPRARALPRAREAARHAPQGPRGLHRAGDRRARAASSTTAGIEAELQGRPKHIYSIWKKMQRKGAEFGEIYDVYAIRVLVDEVRDCYAALGIVHALWRPIPGQFDDYIAVPKNNLYQSLHTAVIALDGKPLEIQIRTHAMHQVSEVGIAAHWRYKEGSKADREYDAKLAWLRQLMDWQRDVSESDATEFVEGIKLDIFQDQVFVFTPQGRHQGPAGGRDAARLRVPHPHRRRPPDDRREGQQPPRAARLPAQERRHRRDRHDQGRARPVARLAERRPDLSHAREKIRQWFKRKDRDENIVHGRESLERELRRLARTTHRRPSATTRSPRSPSSTTTRSSTTSTPRSATARSAPSRSSCGSASSTTAQSGAADRRAAASRPGPAASGSRASATCSSASPSAATRSRATRSSGFITRGKGVTVHLQIVPDGAQRARGQPADRGRVGGGAGADLPDRDPRRGVRPDRACSTTSPRSWPRTRSTSWPRTSASARTTRRS